MSIDKLSSLINVTTVTSLIMEAHKGDLRHSLLAQFPRVCGKNVRMPFKKRDLCQSGNVHNGKTIPFAMRESPKCSLCALARHRMLNSLCTAMRPFTATFMHVVVDEGRMGQHP